MNVKGNETYLSQFETYMNSRQFVDISKLGLNSKIKTFSYSFICGKGYSPPRGRMAFCLQSGILVDFPAMIK